MSSVVISGDSSGQVSLTVPSAAGTNTATLPAATGTVMVSGNMPAFSAVPSSSTSVSNAAFTKITYNTKEFDTNTNYDAVNSKFTPTVAGYYLVMASLNYSSASLGGNNSLIAFYKNGAWAKSSSGGQISYFQGNAIIYMNGSTDYLEIYAYQNSGGTLTTSASTDYQFSACLIRGA